MLYLCVYCLFRGKVQLSQTYLRTDSQFLVVLDVGPSQVLRPNGFWGPTVVPAVYVLGHGNYNVVSGIKLRASVYQPWTMSWVLSWTLYYVFKIFSGARVIVLWIGHPGFEPQHNIWSSGPSETRSTSWSPQSMCPKRNDILCLSLVFIMYISNNGNC